MTEETFRMLTDLTAAITIASAFFALGAWKADRDLKRQRRACPPPEFVVAQEGERIVVDLDGHEEGFRLSDVEVLPAPTPRSQRFFEWLFTTGIRWLALLSLVALIARIAYELVRR